MACTRHSTLMTSTIMSKDFTPIAKLPLRPLRISHLLGRYVFIKGEMLEQQSHVLAANNPSLTIKEIAKTIANEVDELYTKVGLQPITRRAIIDKIVRTHKQYRKIQRKPLQRGPPEFEDSHISFLSKKQPRLATVKQDLE